MYIAYRYKVGQMLLTQYILIAETRLDIKCKSTAEYILLVETRWDKCKQQSIYCLQKQVGTNATYSLHAHHQLIITNYYNTEDDTNFLSTGHVEHTDFSSLLKYLPIKSSYPSILQQQ